MTIQPVLIHNIFFAEGKSCGSKGFCTKATACNAKKEQMSEEKHPEAKSCSAKKELMAEAKDNQTMACNSKKQRVAEANACRSKRIPEPCKEEPEKGCTKKDCRPFTVCSSCCIIPMDRPVFSFSYFVQKTEKARLINENISSNYISDSWHPPEFI